MSDPGRYELLGRSGAMDRVRRFARRAGRTEVPVLIGGETGTGKSLLARIIHHDGNRRRGPFVGVNCAGVPEGLFETEFFGHRKGAFTGAVEARRGLIEAASGGTLFLDEVADLPLMQQAKLLTVLEERQVRRVGEARSVEVDVRVVAASSVEISAAMVAGRFRPDLYHRIALLRCTLPPLRERPEDILFLAERMMLGFVRKHAHEDGCLTPAVRDRLLAHRWPGNVRELAHVLEAALILTDGAALGVEHLEEAMAYGPHVPDASVPAQSPSSHAPSPAPEPPVTDGSTAHSPPPLTRSTVPAGTGSGEPPTGPGSDHPAPPASPAAPGDDRERIRAALERCGGDRTLAARDLGMARSTLRTKIVRYGLG